MKLELDLSKQVTTIQNNFAITRSDGNIIITRMGSS